MRIEIIEKENPNIKGRIQSKKNEISTEIRIGNKKRKIDEEEILITKEVKENKPQRNADFVYDWTPPPGQTGDGKTELNNKYGY